eukprot:Ihof_evm9s5 gene=Ihof_evmTU9s5
MNNYLLAVLAAILFGMAVHLSIFPSPFTHFTKARPVQITDSPIIGILTLPFHGASSVRHSAIPASYVKCGWLGLEGGGARVIPISYDLPLDEIRDLHSSLNGVIFTGGDSFLDPVYYQAGELLLNLTKEATVRGEYVPLWGTCLGFEFLLYLVACNKNLFEKGPRFDSMNLSLPLQFNAAAQTSRMYGPIYGTTLWDVLANEGVTPNEHRLGISPKDFNKYKINKVFTSTSTNVDRKGQLFVSSMEAKAYPIYGVQWHPEKIQYEWERHHGISHSKNAIQVGQYMAEFFVNEARQN